MTLEDWGWTDFFAEQFANWSKKGLLPARVIRGEKNYFRVWSTCRWSATGSQWSLSPINAA